MSEANGITTNTESLEVMRTFQSLLASRAQLASQIGKAFGGERDYYDTLGYDRSLTIDKYHGRFERQDISSRIITAYPDTTWRYDPMVYQGQPDATNQFNTEWMNLNKRLKLISYFKRADTLACIGRFSLLFIGFNDVTDTSELQEEVSRQQGRDLRVQFISPYSERHVRIADIDENITSPRFGLPSFYDIDFNRTTQALGESNRARRDAGNNRTRVHWSRVIHIADGLLEDDVYGIPKMRPVYNLIDDLVKIAGGGAEMFWRNARRDLILQVDAEARLSDADLTAMRDKAEDYIHDLRKVLGVEGTEVKTLAPAIASPKDHFDVIKQLISGTTGIPQRILFGSERGELASSQDEGNWVDRNIVRQSTYAEPVILRAFIDRLIAYRAFPAPAGEYEVEWPSLFSIDENERAERAEKYANALNTYYSGIAPEFFPPEEFRSEYLNLEPQSPFGDPQLDEAIDSQDDDNAES